VAADESGAAGDENFHEKAPVFPRRAGMQSSKKTLMHRRPGDGSALGTALATSFPRTKFIERLTVTADPTTVS
jgi:hypothetical protein